MFATHRRLAAAIGASVIIGSCFMKYVPGNLLEVTGKTANLLAAPIFCLFFFALFVKFASPAGVWIGALFGIATAALIAFSGPIFGHNPVTGRDDDELYDLRADPNELVNLAARPEHTRMKHDLVRRMWRFAHQEEDTIINGYTTVAVAPWGPAEAFMPRRPNPALLDRSRHETS